MLSKKADYDAELRELRALERTCSPSVRQKVVNHIQGVEGEKSTAHYLNRAFGHDDEFAVLHDVRIGIAGDFAQTDHVVIDRVTGIAWVVETKNLNGTMSWNAHGDWTVRYGSKVYATESPVAQAQRHCASLMLWFGREGMPIRETRPVVLIGAKTGLSRGDHEVDVPVLKADVFPSWFRDNRFAPMGPRSDQVVVRSTVSAEDLRRIGERLSAAHVPFKGDWRSRIETGTRAADAWPTLRARRTPIRGTRRMPAHGRSAIETMLMAAGKTQNGALIFGGLGVVLASPMPHAMLDAFAPGSYTDNIYVGMTASGALGAAYMMIPWVRIFGLTLAAVAVVTMVVQGRRSTYRTHLRTVAANAIGAAALGGLALAAALYNPPRLLPGNREAAEMAAVVTGRRTTPAAPIASTIPVGTTFPENGTIQWGEEQPIGGNLERLDIWDVTGSAQNKVVNVRSGLVVDMPGVRTAPYATVYVRAGERVSLRLPAGRPYRVTAMSGSEWKGLPTLFGPDAVTVDFGMVSITPGQPQVVAMGAPDQTANVVPGNRF